MTSKASGSSTVAAVMLSGTLLLSLPVAAHADDGSLSTHLHGETVFAVATKPLELNLADADTNRLSFTPSWGDPDLHSPGSLGTLADDAATPTDPDLSSIPAIGGSVAGPIALAAIGALLVGGALVSLSRRTPVNPDDPLGPDPS